MCLICLIFLYDKVKGHQDEKVKNVYFSHKSDILLVFEWSKSWRQIFINKLEKCDDHHAKIVSE